MNKQRIVRLSNVVGIIAISALIYWVFIFISIEAFGLKVFKNDLVSTFYISILGILAVMAGTLMINIMLNLTIIAEKVKTVTPVTVSSKIKMKTVLVLLTFPAIIVLLYIGDYFSSKKYENYLISSANYLISKHQTHINELTNYRFEKQYFEKAEEIISVLSKSEEKIPNITLIVPDTIDGIGVYLHISDDNYFYSCDTTLPEKKKLIHTSSKEEKEYIETVFRAKNKGYRFSSNNGNYELYYPYSHNGKIVIFFFTDNKQYEVMRSS